MLKKIRFSPEESTLSQQCFDQIQEEIVSGQLKPGQKLKVADLKSRFSIGQSPVREALSRLAASGLVAIEDNKGFRVSRISEADARDTYAIFTAIENMALALSIKNGDDAWQARIVGELHKLSLIEQSNESIAYKAWAERNYDFHVVLISACKSPLLLDIRRMLYLKFDRYCTIAYTVTQHNLELNYQAHYELAQAALNKETKKAQSLMYHHINDALAGVITELKKNKLI